MFLLKRSWCLFLTSAVTFVSFQCHSQPLPPPGATASFHQVDTVLYGRHLNYTLFSKSFNGRVIKGIVLGGSQVEARISYRDSVFMLSPGRSDSKQVVLSCRIPDMQPGKLFNGRVNGQRVGIWVDYHRHRVKHLRMYRQGLPEVEVDYRTNGTIELVTFFKEGKKQDWGNWRYDEEGYVTRQKGFH
jgi:hypothetical protein